MSDDNPFWLWGLWGQGSFTFTFKTRSEEKIRGLYCSAKTPPTVFFSPLFMNFYDQFFALVSNHVSVPTLKMQSWLYFQWVNTPITPNESPFFNRLKEELAFFSGVVCFCCVGLSCCTGEMLSSLCCLSKETSVCFNSVYLPVFENWAHISSVTGL